MLPNNNELIPNSYILELIGRNVRWSYLTYDFKKAREEFEKTSDTSNYPRYYSPRDILTKYSLFRIGKVYNLQLSYRGNLEYITVGRTKYYTRTFPINDIGVNLKPRIFKCDDIYNLIEKGYAVEEQI